MIFWKKKKTKWKDDAGKSTEEVPVSTKRIEMLNFVPIEYRYSKEYLNYYAAEEAEYRKILDKRSKGVFRTDAFDADIDAHIDAEKSNAKAQFTRHLYLIAHEQGILRGELQRGRALLEQLKRDQARLEAELAGLERIKKEKKIV